MLATGAEEAPGARELGQIGSLAENVAEQVAPAVAQAFSLAKLDPPPPRKIRIGLISSGVDTAALPESVRNQITLLGSGGDPMGYGTYASSLILQAAPGAAITSIGVYPGGHFDPNWQSGALDWLVANAKDLDVVLYAVPPSEFLDPISASMAKGEWGAMSDAMSQMALTGTHGQPTYGLPLNSQLRAQQTAGQPYYEKVALDRFAYVTNRWTQVQQQVGAITAAGVAVVAPAGDLGPKPQTIAGIANLPGVVTVGSFDGNSVSPHSSSGPSIDGKVKPDLLASAGMAGVLPATSSLAKLMDSKKLLDSSLSMEWSFGDPPSAARTRLDSSISSAAVVAAGMGNMAAEGLRDVARQRGALTAASVPIPGVPVWRQGDGLLRRLPTAELAASRPIALAHGDLGAEPESAEWSADIPFAGGAPASATATSPTAITIGPNARNVITTDGSLPAPPVGASVSESGLKLSLPLGDSSYRGGLYCGYSEVSIPTTSGGVDPVVDVYGIPAGTEQIPHCFVKGTQLTAKSFYIHDIPAPHLTFGLLPEIPAGQSILDHALMLLPVDPLATKLFFKVTQTEPYIQKHPRDPDPANDQHQQLGVSYAHFPNIPPGYYKVREFSDYGSPITQTLTDSSGNPVRVNGKPATSSTDIGERAAYQSFPALVLGPVCTDTPAGSFEPALDKSSGAQSPCTDEWLKQQVGAGHFADDKPTSTYFVDPTGIPDEKSPSTFRVAFDFLRKMPGAGVTSRVIDMIDCKDLNFGTLDVSAVLQASSLQNAIGALPIDACNPAGAGGLLSAIPAPIGAGDLPSSPLAPVGSGQLVLSSGTAVYPFNLATPNYKAHMSLNFHYSLTNSLIVAVVVVGEDVNWGVVTPKGQFILPSTSASKSVNLSAYSPSGQAEGDANFEFHMLPKGASKGTLILAVVPASNISGKSTVVSSTSLSNMSFELDTWNNTLWPATNFVGLCPAPQKACGHSFQVDSNFNRDPVRKDAAGPRYQMTGACRDTAVPGSTQAARVCEDWTVMVHSPGDDAATFDVADPVTGASVVPQMQVEGAKFYDPVRDINDFSSALVIPSVSIAAFEASARVPFAFQTDGSHWEQLNLPMAVNKAHPGPVEFRIRDNQIGRQSSLFPHVTRSADGSVTGGVQVAPYQPFRSTASLLP